MGNKDKKDKKSKKQDKKDREQQKAAQKQRQQQQQQQLLPRQQLSRQQVLAQQLAHQIAQHVQERPSDAARRRTTQVVHVMPEGGPRPVSQDSRMMSPREGDDSPTGTFTRGSRLRSSLPVVRSPNKSLERPMGLVFLTFRSETKRALLPNEVTSLDTVRALFVRSFSECLSMQWFEIPSHKIYILDQKTNVFYELDDVREVKDRSVLKIYETGLSPPAPGSPTPHSPQASDYLTLHQHHPGYESDSSMRSGPSGPGLPGSGIRSPLHHPPLSPRLYQTSKAQTMPGHNNAYACPQQIKGTYATPYPPGQHPPSQLPLAQSQQAPGSHWSPTLHSHQHVPGQAPRPEGQYGHAPSNQSSPQRVQHVHQAVAASQRHSLACLPDPNTYSDGRMPQSRSYHDYPNGVAPPSGHTSGTATPTHTDSEAKSRMDHMEAQLANLTAWVQTTVMKNQSEGSRPGSARSNSSVISEGSYSAKSSMSDISSVTPQPMISVDMQNTIRALHHHTRDLRSEVNKLRRLQVTNMETMRESIHDTYKKLKEVIGYVPGAGDQPVRFQRHQVNYKLKDYNDDGKQIAQELIDLEKSVDELRNDVLNRKCRVNVNEIENMALALSNIAKSLGELKANFPALQEEMKAVMQGEMKIVVEEEKLAIVQEHNEPLAPVMPPSESTEEDHLAILEEIKCMVPDHNARLTSVQAAENARERKKKLDSRSEALRFEKSLAMVQKQLKEPPGGAKDRAAGGLNPVQEESAVTEKTSQSSQESSDQKYDDASKKSASKSLGMNEESFLAQCKDEENYISSLRLSAFESSPVSSANSDSTQEVTSRSKTPSWTSTPKDQGVAKSSAPDSSGSTFPLSASGQEGKKKVPPPPPPRRSSRSTIKSPTPNAQKAAVNFVEEPQALHMYENLEDLSASDDERTKDAAGRTLNGSPGTRVPRPKSASEALVSDRAQKDRPRSQYSPTKGKQSPTKGQYSPVKVPSSPTRIQYSPTKLKKLNKFQQELAAGIYSNLNRPDLQQQNVNPALIVHDATSPESSSSNSSSSTSLDSQLGGTIKRNKNAKLDDKQQQQQQPAISEQKSPTNKTKKIPPPPPQRKTSTLSQHQKDNRKTDETKTEPKVDQAKADADEKKAASAGLHGQYEQRKAAQKDGHHKPVHNGGGGGTAEETKCTVREIAGSQSVVVKSVSSSPPMRVQTGPLQLAPSKTLPTSATSKLAAVSNGDVSKTAKSCTVKVEVRGNRKFEETEIY